MHFGMQAMQAFRAGVRRAAQLRAPAGNAQQSRGMASAPGVDDFAESLKWKHVSRAGVMGCILFYMFAIEHPPTPQEQPKYEYLRVRTKEFPWGEKGLFEYWMTPGDDE